MHIQCAPIRWCTKHPQLKNPFVCSSKSDDKCQGLPSIVAIDYLIASCKLYSNVFFYAVSQMKEVGH